MEENATTADKQCLVNKIDHLEVAVAKIEPLQKLFEIFGFYCTQTRQDASGRSHLLEQGHIKMLLSEGAPGSFAADYVKKHGDGVCRMVFAVNDSKYTYNETIKRGASGIDAPVAAKDEFLGATINTVTSAISSFGSVRATFLERHVDASATQKIFTKPFLPGFRPTEAASHENPNDVGFKSIDHLTNNVEMGTLDHWAEFYKRTYGFIETRYFDIKASKTGLTSKVMQTPSGSVKIPINQATEKKSQVQEFIDMHKGAGVQHIALTTSDIQDSVKRLMKNGVKFLEAPPDTYYEAVKTRVPNVKENIDDLQKLKVLIDGDETGYLLQIFTENQIGPLFFELIDRHGHKGFGEGNFSALFEAIERDQERRGVL
ncbi:MAG: 4-hydroxyphenylpyruvate dioxygenase [Bdellovibrionota bacterium]